MVQFYSVSAAYSSPTELQLAYPTDYGATALALAHHVSCTSAHLTTRQLLSQGEVGVRLPQAPCQLRGKVFVLNFATQRVLDELVAVLQQVGAKLAACPRETVQRVEVELAGKLSDNTVP